MIQIKSKSEDIELLCQILNVVTIYKLLNLIK